MKACFYGEHGGPDVLQYADVADPEPAPADVVVEVQATAINHLDMLQRNGYFTMPGFAMPHIAGMDVAGVVESVGSEVDGVAVGDRVVVDPAMSEVPDASKRSGHGDLYGELGIIGATVDGGYAERCLVPHTHIHRVPDDVPLTDAASTPTVYMTAWHALVEVGRLQAGETLLIHAAGSGVSSAGIQLAKHLGATVLATAGTEEKLEWATQLGADHVLNNRTGDVTAFAREATAGAGVNMVFDHIGPALWEASLFATGIHGRIVFCGNVTGNEVTVNLGYAYHHAIQILGSGPYGHDEFAKMLETAWSAGFRSIVDSSFPLSDAGAAQEKVSAAEFMGKVLLIP